MAHDVFISYSTKDQNTADAICHVLEENNIKCWIAPRDITSGKPYGEEIIDGIKGAKIIVLVFSENSQNSPYVNNEIDTAFSNNKTILSFKIDESMPKDRMEFFLKNKHWLEAYPEPEKVFETLVHDVKLLCKEDTEDEEDDKSENNIVKEKSNVKNLQVGQLFNKHKMPIIALIIIIALCVVGLFVINNSSDLLGGNSQFEIEITDVNVEDDSDTEYAEYWNYSYFAYAKITYDKENVSDYDVETTFYDASDKKVDGEKVKLDTLKEGEEELVGSGYSKSDDATKVVIKILDSKGNAVAQQEYKIK